ncbi:DUF1304 domain-containing protein [uncultured Rothia sp.]|uniref:DUF1304 domain-containing protein n=1 Tax=uncultured Rothia sp. TaxID=316088 RepID=UPI00321683BD
MTILASIFIALAVLIHIYIWVLETFLWDKPKGLKTFNMDANRAALTKEMAANQGLYNLMLAMVALVGLILLWPGTISTGKALIFAGAGSMAVAGIFLFVTSPDKRRPALVQLLPPLIGVISTALI